ncbi:MAG TPA: hypothetical protein VNA24_04460 [Hyalangium sp.]|nr:hypothetical protein [Hyalangium sp.]
MVSLRKLQLLAPILVLSVNGGCQPQTPVVQEVVVLAGGNAQSFWTYDLDTDTWSTLPDVPGAIGPGGALAQLQRLGAIYALRGGGTTDFYRLDMNAGVWSQLAATPGPVNAGGALVGINYGTQSQRDRLYALQGGGSTSVWDYDVASNAWTTIAQVPEPVGDGGGIASPNIGQEGTLELIAGGGSTRVHRLDVASGTWSTLGAAPAPVLAGGSIFNLFNSCDYAFTGGGSTAFFSTGTLCTSAGSLAATPAPVMAGAGVTAAPGLGGVQADWVFATRGGGTTDFWRYSISADSWSAMAATPGPISVGGAIVEVRPFAP